MKIVVNLYARKPPPPILIRDAGFVGTGKVMVKQSDERPGVGAMLVERMGRVLLSCFFGLGWTAFFLLFFVLIEAPLVLRLLVQTGAGHGKNLLINDTNLT
ncbi:MAG: hypothetical protein AAGD22_07720 [Verrucomicrobiota bacterium]